MTLWDFGCRGLSSTRALMLTWGTGSADGTRGSRRVCFPVTPPSA